MTFFFEKLDELNKNESKTVPLRLDCIEKQEIDRSTLYSVDGPFQLVHEDIGNLIFLGKWAAHPNYCFVAVDVYSSKVCVYPMEQRDLLTKNCFIKIFHQKGKRKNLDYHSIKNFKKIK